MRFFKNPVIMAHQMAGMVLRPGQRAIDATAGNGHDTLFLAKQVGPTGEVFAFDKQPLAIHHTAQRLKEAAVDTRVYLLNIGHEQMKNYVSGRFQAIMFNLGYLPGAERRFATRPETTVPALQQGLELLSPRGILLVVVYVGHAGAREEQQAIEEWVQTLPQPDWDVLRCSYPNRTNNPPYLLAIQRVAVTPV